MAFGKRLVNSRTPFCLFRFTKNQLLISGEWVTLLVARVFALKRPFRGGIH